MAAMTHENYINAIASLAAARLARTDAVKVEGIKLVYGAGSENVRGVTYYRRWHQCGQADAAPLVEITALGEESWVQLAGTTLHELGHVIAPSGAGHRQPWKDACRRLGLRCVRAAGTHYCLAMIESSLREAIAAIPRPADGNPVGRLTVPVRPCGAGIGTRGGVSRGVGSGSRLRRWVCGCGCIARVASDDFRAVHIPCGTVFTCS